MKYFSTILILFVLLNSCSTNNEEQTSPLVEFVKTNINELTKNKSNDSKILLLAYSNSACMDCLKMTLKLLEIHLKEKFILLTLTDQHDHSFLKANLPSKVKYDPIDTKVPFKIENVTLFVIKRKKIQKVILPNLADKSNTSNEIHEALETFNSTDNF
jgi:thioredoxin-related protein